MRKNITECKTRCGISAQKAIEALRLYVIDGKLDHAIDIAYDLYRTSQVMLEELWNQLEIIAVMHIGLADFYALSYVYGLRCICYDSEPYTPESGGMQALCFIHSIRYLCNCPKEKFESLDQVINQIEDCYEQGIYAEIPSFARDHHNHAGRELGHTPLDFLDEEGGSKVIPEVMGASVYKERLRNLLKPIYGGEDRLICCTNGYNHFYEMESPHGLNLELLQSSFQKTIRRGMEKEALMITYEAFLTGWEIEKYLWERIVIMSVEDIGMGEKQCSSLMYAYYKAKEHYLEDEKVRMAFLMQAVRYLCRCNKERGTELIKGILVQEFKDGKVPDTTILYQASE